MHQFSPFIGPWKLAGREDCRLYLREQELQQLALYYEIASLNWRIRFLVPRLHECIVYMMMVITNFLASAITM